MVETKANVTIALTAKQIQDIEAAAEAAGMSRAAFMKQAVLNAAKETE